MPTVSKWRNPGLKLIRKGESLLFEGEKKAKLGKLLGKKYLLMDQNFEGKVWPYITQSAIQVVLSHFPVHKWYFSLEVLFPASLVRCSSYSRSSFSFQLDMDPVKTTNANLPGAATASNQIILPIIPWVSSFHKVKIPLLLSEGVVWINRPLKNVMFYNENKRG